MSMVVQIGSFSRFVNGETPEPVIKKGNINEMAAHVVSLTPIYSKTEIANAGFCGKFLEQLINGVYYTFACPTKLIYCSLANALVRALNFNRERAPVLTADLSVELKLQKETLSRMIENNAPFQSRQILLILNTELKLKNDPSIRKLIEGLKNQQGNAEDEALEFIKL